ncbi:MAG: hypothetical protein RLY86_2219 [Pseudomonadota bacterium]|jgi:hypothetical protein
MSGYRHRGIAMHDVFSQDDLTNDAQHRALIHWLTAATMDPAVPADVFDPDRVPAGMLDSAVLLVLAGRSIRDALIARASDGIVAGLGRDPTGLTLARLMPPSYLADLIPAYALCAGAFRPLSSLDEVTYEDGDHLLVRRLILPLDRQPPSADFAAGSLLMIFGPADSSDQGRRSDGTFKTMVAVRSLGLSLFRDRSDRRSNAA